MTRLLTTHVETHLDALESLLPLRAQAETGRCWTLPRVQELDERIAAHSAALHLFADDLSRVMAAFVAQHPLAVAYVHSGKLPPGEPESETLLQTRARVADAAEGVILAGEIWSALAGSAAGAAGAAAPFAALADLGRPGDIVAIMDHFSAGDAQVAVAAGRAFSIMAGGRCDSTHRITLAPADGHQPDAFEQAFLEQAWLPDVHVARAHWATLGPAVEHALRINRGFIVDDATASTHAGIDRREAAAAALRFRRRSNG